jgi:hypothetical protein
MAEHGGDAGGEGRARPIPSRRALATALLAGIAAWAAHFLLTYFLLTLACAGLGPAGAWIALVTAAATLLTAGVALWAARSLRRGGHGPGAGFLLRSAILANAYVVLLLLLEAAALAAVGPWCDGG